MSNSILTIDFNEHPNHILKILGVIKIDLSELPKDDKEKKMNIYYTTKRLASACCCFIAKEKGLDIDNALFEFWESIFNYVRRHISFFPSNSFIYNN